MAHEYTRTEIEHHEDGSHTVRHIGKNGDAKSYAVADLDGVHEGLEDCLECENDDEGRDENGEEYGGEA